MSENNSNKTKNRITDDALGRKSLSYFFDDDETSGRTDELNELLQSKKNKFAITAIFTLMMVAVLGLAAAFIIINSR